VHLRFTPTTPATLGHGEDEWAQRQYFSPGTCMYLHYFISIIHFERQRKHQGNCPHASNKEWVNLAFLTWSLMAKCIIVLKEMTVISSVMIWGTKIVIECIVNSHTPLWRNYVVYWTLILWHHDVIISYIENSYTT
jgi:uncharacterized membrane protein